MSTMQLDNIRAILSDLDFSNPFYVSEALRPQAITAALESDSRNNIQAVDIRSAANTFALEAAIGLRSEHWANVLTALTACLQNGISLRSTDDYRWREALLIANLYTNEGKFSFSNARIKAVAECGKSIVAQGFRISVRDEAYSFDDGELERATQIIRDALAELGPGNAIGNIFRALGTVYPFDFSMYLPHRRYAQGDGTREPSVPFSFLLNLAVSTKFPRAPTPTPADSWQRAVKLSQEVIGCLNIEPYFNMSHMFISPDQIVEQLRELSLYDHLFALRQWPYDFTCVFIEKFFGDEFDDILRDRLGWTPKDVVTLIDATEHFVGQDPNLITIGALVSAGVPKKLLQAMLPHFAAPFDKVNGGYNSPLAAKDEFNLMFKPFISHGSEHLLLPASTLLGPAFFEATLTALRPLISRSVADDLSGKGTERVTGDIFRRAKLQPTHEAAKYCLADIGDGECDFIFETERSILFVECKAKSLTRAAMAGVSGEALLDFAGGIFNAQKQALRHERILRQSGSIRFQDGSEIKWSDRKICRLSLTLLDLGAMQDRMLFSSLFESLSRSSVRAEAGFGKIKQVKALDRELEELRVEISFMEKLGVDIKNQTRYIASLSLGQLEACLSSFDGDLDELCNQLYLPMTHGALNPLVELHFLRRTQSRARVK